MAEQRKPATRARRQRFGEAAVAKQLCTKDQVDECLRLQQREAGAGMHVYLGGLLVSRGYMTAGEALWVLRAQGVQIAADAITGHRYNIHDYDPAVEYRSPEAPNPLTVPPRIGSIAVRGDIDRGKFTLRVVPVRSAEIAGLGADAPARPAVLSERPTSTTATTATTASTATPSANHEPSGTRSGPARQTGSLSREAMRTPPPSEISGDAARRQGQAKGQPAKPGGSTSRTQQPAPKQPAPKQPAPKQPAPKQPARPAPPANAGDNTRAQAAPKPQQTPQPRAAQQAAKPQSAKPKTSPAPIQASKPQQASKPADATRVNTPTRSAEPARPAEPQKSKDVTRTRAAAKAQPAAIGSDPTGTQRASKTQTASRTREATPTRSPAQAQPAAKSAATTTPRTVQPAKPEPQAAPRAKREPRQMSREEALDMLSGLSNAPLSEADRAALHHWASSDPFANVAESAFPSDELLGAFESQWLVALLGEDEPVPDAVAAPTPATGAATAPATQSPPHAEPADADRLDVAAQVPNLGNLLLGLIMWNRDRSEIEQVLGLLRDAGVEIVIDPTASSGYHIHLGGADVTAAGSASPSAPSSTAATPMRRTPAPFPAADQSASAGGPRADASSTQRGPQSKPPTAPREPTLMSKGEAKAMLSALLKSRAEKAAPAGKPAEPTLMSKGEAKAMLGALLKSRAEQAGAGGTTGEDPFANVAENAFPTDELLQAFRSRNTLTPMKDVETFVAQLDFLAGDGGRPSNNPGARTTSQPKPGARQPAKHRPGRGPAQGA